MKPRKGEHLNEGGLKLKYDQCQNKGCMFVREECESLWRYRECEDFVVTKERE